MDGEVPGKLLLCRCFLGPLAPRSSSSLSLPTQLMLLTQPQEPGIERLHLREGWDKSMWPFGSQKHFDAAKRKKKVPIFLMNK